MFHERLRQLRKKHGLSQQELSNALGLGGKAVISSYENPDKSNQPTLGTLKNMAQYFNVSIDYLVGLCSDCENDISVMLNKFINGDITKEFLNEIYNTIPYQEKEKLHNKSMFEFFNIVIEKYFLFRIRCIDFCNTEKKLEDILKSIIANEFARFVSYDFNESTTQEEVSNTLHDIKNKTKQSFVFELEGKKNE